MSLTLKGAPLAGEILAKAKQTAEMLHEKGTPPTLAIVRVGEREDDISYEKSLIKRCEQNGVSVKSITLKQDISTESLIKEIEIINDDSAIHGCLLFRPLPKHIDETAVRNTLCPQKDVDGICDLSLAGVFTDSEACFAPCTAKASVEILKHYEITLKGKKAVVVGRSLVVGKPLAMLLLKENATVKICHTKTENLADEVKTADIVFACAGKAKMVTKDFIKQGSVVVDVGINFDDDGMCGDVDFVNVEQITDAITPVPGGIGAVTTALLISNVVKVASKG